MPTFTIYEDSLQERFQASRAKIQLFGGGFANGKTANACIKALQLAKDYPGSNGLIARATYPKLNDTIRKEFIKWCPENWIKSFPKASNTCVLTNQTEVNFRYVQQQGKQAEASTSNLLSSTFDWIVVDQMDDPEFQYKDYLDLLGRLRGSARYEGDDPTMPTSGPRWMMLTANPTRNWFFRRLIKPIHDYQRTGKMGPDLRASVEAYGGEGNIDDFIELFEGSTYENADNLPADFIRTLEATYTGQMRERFLMGEWGAYDGLVYPMFDEFVHSVSKSHMHDLFIKWQNEGYDVPIIEAYDHGIAVESCYLLAFADPWGSVHILDGFYEKELSIDEMTRMIKRIRDRYLRKPPDKAILADPAIFRRASGDRKTVGTSTSQLFWNNGLGVRMIRGNNDIINGIVKVQSYLNMQRMKTNPYTGELGSPNLFVSEQLEWWIAEISDYYWQKRDDQNVDKPMDRNDHAMDTTKYLLSHRPALSNILYGPQTPKIPAYMTWQETEHHVEREGHRYG